MQQTKKANTAGSSNSLSNAESVFLRQIGHMENIGYARDFKPDLHTSYLKC